MAGVFEKIKRFFKRKTSEDAEGEGEIETKRMRYVSTPAITFTPRQIETKRVQRQCYTYKEIINTTEDRNYEFKAGGGMCNPDVLRDYVCKYGPAFLNAEGGVLIGGVTDDGTVEGIFMDNSKEVRMIQLIHETIRMFRPVVRKEMFRISFVPVRAPSRFSSGLKVVELYVNKGDQNSIYENGRHQVFVRRDGGVQGPLRPLSIKDLVIEKYHQVLNDRKKSQEANKIINKITLTHLSEDIIPEEKGSEDLDSSCEIVFVKSSPPKEVPSVSKNRPAEQK